MLDQINFSISSTSDAFDCTFVIGLTTALRMEDSFVCNQKIFWLDSAKKFWSLSCVKTGCRGRLGLLSSEHLIYQLVLEDSAAVRLHC